MAHPSRETAVRKAKLPLCLQAALLLSTAAPTAFAGVVQNCGDGGPGSGSLRDVIAAASPSDTIDLSQLPAKCGSADSVITLSAGEIPIPQVDLKLQGPSIGSVTIRASAAAPSRVLNHSGTGLLVLNSIVLADGEINETLAGGGCLRSAGTVLLADSTVRDCAAYGVQSFGGGLWAEGGIALLNSKITGNKAMGSTEGNGGGIAAYGGITIIGSTISGNEASRFGGGAFSYSTGAYDSVSYSTLDHNVAENCGGAAFYTAGSTIDNATVADNTAEYSFGGVCVQGSVAIHNSTIAFNAAPHRSAGLKMWSSLLTLQSSIIALNGTNSSVPDLEAGDVDGSDNLVMTWSANMLPGVVTLSSNPKLSPILEWNGGVTRTHRLQADSPAIGMGNNYAGSWFDQRGRGYPRSSGTNYATDIGAFQFDSIFYGDLDP